MTKTYKHWAIPLLFTVHVPFPEQVEVVHIGISQWVPTCPGLQVQRGLLVSISHSPPLSHGFGPEIVSCYMK